MFKKTKNKVARILKCYSVINFIVCLIIVIYYAIELEEVAIFIGGLSVAICTNFVIYAFGELMDLLAQIKDNTKSTGKKDIEASFELPDL